MKQNLILSEFTETWAEKGVIIQKLNLSIKEISLPIAKQMVMDRKIVTNEIPMPILVIVGNVVNVDRASTKYYQEDEPYLNIQAIAMLIDNWVAKVIGNLVFKVKKNPVPIEFFNSKAKAIAWLEQYK